MIKIQPDFLLNDSRNVVYSVEDAVESCSHCHQCTASGILDGQSWIWQLTTKYISITSTAIVSCWKFESFPHQTHRNKQNVIHYPMFALFVTINASMHLCIGLSVFLCVCASVQVTTFEPLKLGTSFVPYLGQI